MEAINSAQRMACFSALALLADSRSLHCDTTSSDSTILLSSEQNSSMAGPSHMLGRSTQRVSHKLYSCRPTVRFRTKLRLPLPLKNATTSFIVPTAFLTLWTDDDFAKDRLSAWLKHGQRIACGTTFCMVHTAPQTLETITLQPSVPIPTHWFLSRPSRFICSSTIMLLSSLSPSLVAWPKESAPNRRSEVVVRVAKLTTKTGVVYSE